MKVVIVCYEKDECSYNIGKMIEKEFEEFEMDCPYKTFRLGDCVLVWHDKDLVEEDVSVCYPIETQNIREQCFMLLAEKTKDESICRNLLGSLRETCKAVSK